ncbi:MAG: SocA family protein [Gammaproteobacteria bacterium]|nr:SocA family protein [Gammaproteobacteria bacterium]
MDMEFKFDQAKTTQAAAMLLNWHGGTMTYMKLIKLLYMADRTALDRMDEPITGAKYVSMKLGPVLSEVFDLINYGPDYDGEGEGEWIKHISPPKDYSVSVRSDPGIGELCEEEEEILKEVYDLYGHVEVFKLSRMTHRMLPEWRNPYDRAYPIEIKDILQGLGKTAEDIKEVHNNIERKNYLELIIND